MTRIQFDKIETAAQAYVDSNLAVKSGGNPFHPVSQAKKHDLFVARLHERRLKKLAVLKRAIKGVRA